jgi:Flp pilus assembly secretin CpaC
MTCLNRIARAALVVATTVALGGVAAAADAQTLTRLYLSKDRSQLVDLREPAAKVAVTNPGIADVQVISPNQILVMGRAVGVTSMVVFADKAVARWLPSPCAGRRTASSCRRATSSRNTTSRGTRTSSGSSWAA